MEFVDSVESTPDVGHFVFEETASKGKDAVGDLDELNYRRVVDF